MSLGYVLGLLALGGLPAVVAIHLLRVRARRVPVATLFLIPRSEVDDRGGRRFERLRVSPLFWVQILAVLILTWILVEPRWVREDSTLRVVVVVDGSASMSAFESTMPQVLGENLVKLERSASRVEWIVLASDPREKTLYAGSSREEAVAAASSFRARLPSHDPGPVLSTARSIAGGVGLVVYVTDRADLVPPGVELLSVGSAIGNVGFAGIEISEDGSYRAIVKSSSPNPERRQLWIDGEGASALSGETIELAPLELRFVSGRFEAQEESRTLVLEGDRFALDDRLPMVRPRPKVLRVFIAPELATNRFVARFVESLAPVEQASSVEDSDLVLALSRPASKPAILLAPAGSGAGTPSGSLVSEKDPLTEGLNFQGLLVSDAQVPPSGLRPPGSGQARRSSAEAAGRGLLWQGGRALVLLSEGPPSVLVVSFALEESNADRVPAFVLLLHRFAESVRSSVVRFEQRNVELHQLLEGGRAPSEPGFFEVREGDELRLRGAAHFADVREADFASAAPRELGAEVEREKLARNSLGDPLRSLWLVLLLGLVISAAALQEGPKS